MIEVTVENTGVESVAADAGPASLMKYRDPLQLLDVVRPRGDTPELTVRARASWTRLHSQLPPTKVWGYHGRFPGPVIDVRRGQRLRISWVNGITGQYPLVATTTTRVDRLLLPGYDTAAGDRLDARVPAIPPWTVVHLHGARTGAGNDGWSENGVLTGSAQLVEYHNDQPATALWYHDHAMSVTALNVMSGLLGMYVIRDEEEEDLRLPHGRYEVPLILCDRNLDTDASGDLTGQLLHKIVVDAAGLRVVPFFGPFTTVNGTIWPYLKVEARWYRFRLVNASNARTYTLTLVYDDGTPVPAGVLQQAVWQIGTDAGLLPAPVNLPDGLTVAPAERADLLIDFAAFRGRRVQWVNTSPVLPAPEPAVLQFRVSDDRVQDGFTLPQTVSPSFVRLTHDVLPPEHQHRWIVLTPPAVTGMPEMWEMELVDAAEVTVPSDGIVQVAQADGTLLTLRRVAQMLDDTTTFIVKLGEWELWNVLSLGGPVHPFHIHLVRFQAMRRTRYDAHGFTTLRDADGNVIGSGTTAPITSTGSIPLDANEMGWKDTIRVGDTRPPPQASGELVSVAAQFEGGTGRFMYHCHILEHEDRSMMRPFVVVPPSVLVMNPEMGSGHHHHG